MTVKKFFSVFALALVLVMMTSSSQARNRGVIGASVSMKSQYSPDGCFHTHCISWRALVSVHTVGSVKRVTVILPAPARGEKISSKERTLFLRREADGMWSGAWSMDFVSRGFVGPPIWRESAQARIIVSDGNQKTRSIVSISF